MFILRNIQNKDGKPGVALPGDVIITTDLRKSYAVMPDHSHRRTPPEKHAEYIEKYREELAALPERKAKEAQETEAAMKILGAK